MPSPLLLPLRQPEHLLHVDFGTGQEALLLSDDATVGTEGLPRQSWVGGGRG